MTRIATFIGRDVLRRVMLEAGDVDLELLWFPGHEIGIRHLCKIVDDVQLEIAPWLDPKHVTTQTEKGWTIRPSISCPDCGLHGFVTDSVWKPV